jgi:hypothetical protein
MAKRLGGCHSTSRYGSKTRIILDSVTPEPGQEIGLLMLRRISRERSFAKTVLICSVSMSSFCSSGFFLRLYHTINEYFINFIHVPCEDPMYRLISSIRPRSRHYTRDWSTSPDSARDTLLREIYPNLVQDRLTKCLITISILNINSQDPTL